MPQEGRDLSSIIEGTGRDLSSLIPKEPDKPKGRVLAIDMPPPGAKQEWQPPTAEEQALQKPSEGYDRWYESMGGAMIDPTEMASMAGAGARMAYQAGKPLLGVAKQAANWGAYGFPETLANIPKAGKNFMEQILRGMSAKNIEKAIPVEQMAPGMVSDIAGQLRATPLPSHSGVSGALMPADDVAYKTGMYAVTETPKKELTKAKKGLSAYADKMGMTAREKAHLRKTGDVPPPDAVALPTKAGQTYLKEKETLQGINERVRRSFFGDVAAVIETPIRMFEKMGGNAKAQIYDKIDDADTAAVQELVQVITPKVKEWSQGTNSKRIGKYLIGRQEEGEGILKSMGEVVEPLTGAEKEVVKQMDAMYAQFFNRINEARVLAGKKPIEKVENYHTFFRQMEYLIDKLGMNPLDEVDVKKELAKQFINPNSTYFKQAISRTGEKTIPVELDAFNVFKKYSQSALNHINLSPQIAKARQVVEQIKDVNPEAYRDVTLWLNWVAGKSDEGILTHYPWLRGKVSEVTKNVGHAVLSFNIRSALIQPTALRNTLAATGPVKTGEGIYALFRPEVRDFIWKNSNLSGRKYDVTVEQMFKGLRGVKEKVSSAGMKLLGALDQQTAAASWYAFYKKATDVMKYQEKQAIRYANDMVVKTQASARRQHISPLQRSALGKAASALQTFVINDWAFLTQDVLGMGKNVPFTKENFGKVFWYITGTTLINSLYEDGLQVNSPYGTPIRAAVQELEKTDATYLSALKAGGKELMDAVPIIGGAVRYGSGLGGPVIETFDKLAHGENVYEQILKIGGVPGTAQATKTIRRLQKDYPPLGALLGVKMQE